MFHLFCNRTYGEPYYRAAAAVAKERGLDLRQILSARGKRRPLKQWRHRRRLRRETGLDVVHAADVNAASFIASISPGDHGVIAGFDQIFNQALIDRFTTLVNFHPSLLPLYRGPVPSHWCLENGEEWTGYSMHRVTAKIDAGEVLFQEQVPTADVADARALDRRIAEKGAPTLARWLASLVDGILWKPQVLDARALYCTHVDYASIPGRA